MTQHKYITKFSSWIKLNENSDTENEIEERADILCREFREAADTGKLQTSELMIWFNGMMDLYDQTTLKGLIFNKMKPIWANYLRLIMPILSMGNKELTRNDIMRIKQYKQIAQDEVNPEKSANDLLKELGLL